MNYLTHISSESIEKEIKDIEIQVSTLKSGLSVLEKKRELLVELMGLGRSFLPVKKQKLNVEQIKPPATMKDKVAHVLLTNNGLDANMIVDQLRAAHPDLRSNGALKGGVYTIFKRNKEIFKNHDGKWFLEKEKYILGD